jgi:DNA-binding winged helix-turn-helix (wHTH) protein/tetratricopeptide (TPR) repeat protein
VPEGIGKKTVYRFGSFRFDGYVLESKGVPVPLPPKVADTLAALIQRPGELVTKETILQAVWGDTFVQESGLARNISVLRKALEEHGGPGPYIETVAKRGYRFVAPLDGPEFAAPRGRKIGRWGMAAALVAAIVAALAGWRYFSNRPVAQADEFTRIGTHLLSKRTPEDTARALPVFEKAVDANPRSAEAHAGIARTLLLLSRLGRVPEGGLRRAKLEAERAIELDPRSVHGHAARGAALMIGEWKFAEAEAAFRRALSIDPNALMASIYYTQLLHSLGRAGEALPLLDRAQKADPVAPQIGVLRGLTHYWSGDFERAAAEFRTVLERERNDTLANYYLALSYGFQGRSTDALNHLRRAELTPLVLRTDEAWLALRLGDRRPAEIWYRELRQRIAKGEFPESASMLLAASLGRLDEAFASLDAAIAGRDPDVLNLKIDPRLAAMRADPRYAAALRRIGFP